MSAVKSPKYALGKIIILGLLVVALVPVYAQAQSSDIPRTASGRPDFNGIWQALGNAHWDIEPHQARAALQMVPGPVVPVPSQEVVSFGALGAVPPGMGIVVGGEIPYLPQALANRDRNRENWVTLDPAVKCYLPGVPRATYMPLPFQIFQSESAFFITYEFAGAISRKRAMSEPKSKRSPPPSRRSSAQGPVTLWSF